jgi:hypothetical protein
MPSPTVAQIKSRFLAHLSDPNGQVFTDALFYEALGEAYDALFSAFLNSQCPRIQIVSTTTVNAGDLSFVPSSVWSDFADFDLLEERTLGSSDLYRELQQCDQLPQRGQLDRLLDFTWRFDTFWFIGATTSRDLRVTYESSGQAPTSPTATINVDGSLTFLARGAVAAIGQVKGYDELAALSRSIAYGPKYDQGIIGGELFRLVNPRVREMQHVQVAPRPFTLSRRSTSRRIPYVAAQSIGGGMGAPAQFSYSAGSITGTMDGTNAAFYLAYPVSGVVVELNGITLTPTSQYVFGANVVTFIDPYIPQPGNEILVQGWL